MEAFFVRESGSDTSTSEGPVSPLGSAAELLEDLGKRPPGAPPLEIGRSPTGPFRAIDAALRGDADLREALAVELRLPRLVSYLRIRPALLLGLIPPLMLFELDRELAADDVPGATPRLALDVVIILACTRDLARRAPRHPRVTATVFFAAAARFALLVARSCGSGAHPVIFAAMLLAIAAGVATAWKSPSAASLVVDVEDLLPTIAPRALGSEPRQGSLWRALVVAALLPVALVVSGSLAGIWVQGLVLVLWGSLLPQLASSDVDDPKTSRSPYFSGRTAITWGTVGIVLTAALAGGVHYFVDAVAAVVACTHGGAARQATAFMARESNEVVRNVHQARADIAFFFMTVIVSPLFEERIYRGMLQRIASRRFGPSRGIAIAASVFGLAHLGVYRVAIYQTVLLGVAFGAAFEEGGLVASIVTHAIWNLYLLL